MTGGLLALCLFLQSSPLDRAAADIRAGRLEEAERALTQILAQQPDSADAHFYLGVLYFKAGRLDRAAISLNRAAQLTPRRAAVWKALGAVYAAQGEFALAEAPFRQACELAPDEELACYYYGRDLYTENRFEPAVPVFEKALETERPQNLWLVHRGLAQALEALGRAEAAERHFKESIRLAAGRPRPDEDPRVDYGIFLMRQARLGEARAPLEQAAAAFPASARAQYELGRLLAQENELQAAVTHLEKAVAADPAHWAAHLLLGKLYVRLGRVEEGERHLRLGEKGALQ